MECYIDTSWELVRYSSVMGMLALLLYCVTLVAFLERYTRVRVRIEAIPNEYVRLGLRTTTRLVDRLLWCVEPLARELVQWGTQRGLLEVVGVSSRRGVEGTEGHIVEGAEVKTNTAALAENADHPPVNTALPPARSTINIDPFKGDGAPHSHNVQSDWFLW